MHALHRLFCLVLQEGDQVVSVLGLLEATESHLGARNVLLGVLEVLKLQAKLARILLAYFQKGRDDVPDCSRPM